MTTLYLIRHSVKEKNYGIFDNLDSKQIKDEKRILSNEGEKQALLLSQNEELLNIDEVWTSNYVRAIQTAKYICDNNNCVINISSSFDERHYGTFEENSIKDGIMKAPSIMKLEFNDNNLVDINYIEN